MNRLRLTVIALMLLFLCGCRAQLEHEYSSIITHEEQYEVDLYSNALTAENYLGLKNAILSFVETGEDYGVVRIYSYDGDLTSDLANAVYDLTHNDPLVSYAVEYMTYDYAHIVSYYELYFYITFRIDVEILDNIEYCSDISEVEALLERTLLNRSYSAVIRIANYQEFDLEDVLHRLYLNHPELAISEPGYTYTLYPESGIQRILELRISYPYDIMDMLSRAAALEEKVDEISASLSKYSSSTIQIKKISEWIKDHVLYMGEDSQLFTSAHNTLCKEYGNSQGITLSVQLLCDRLSIPCFTVEGTYQGAPWFWNIVYFNSRWHHLDVTTGLINGQSNLQIFYDEEMVDYQWPQDIFPACTDSSSDADVTSDDESSPLLD